MANSDLILRAAAIDAILGSFNAIKAIEELHAVDAAPVVHAYWGKEPDRTNHWHCSNCGHVEGIVSRFYVYCPICGAKMDLEG